MTCDDSLKKVMQWLEKNKTIRGVDSIDLPNFITKSPFIGIDNVPQYTHYYDKAIHNICVESKKKKAGTRGRLKKAKPSAAPKTKKAKKA